MAIGVYTASLGTAFNVAVCPNYNTNNNTCGCSKDGGGNPVPPHPAFSYLPTSPDSRTQSQWLQSCAIEALRNVNAAAASVSTSPVNTLQGLVLT